MREIPQKHVKQNPGEPHRRWFEDDYFDLIVWEDEKFAIIGFQLCYDKLHNQHAITWTEKTGFMHNKVDDGENKPGKYKSTPILVADGIFDHETIAETFKRNSVDLDTNLNP